MTKDEFKHGIRIIQENYNTKFDAEKMKLYYENLKEIPYEQYMQNIENHIKTSAFLPNIAQLRGIEPRKLISDYEQRDYSNIDFNKFYAN